MLRAGRTLQALAATSAAAAVVELRGSSATLDDALDGLERFGALDGDVARVAMEKVVSLDVDDQASSIIAARRQALFATARAHGSIPFVGEAVCRSIANMAMLPDPSASEEAAQHSTAGVVTFATALATEDCIPLVLSVVERGERLTPRGRAWSSMALMNLCMFDDGAARSAATSSADVAAANIVRTILHDAEVNAVNEAALDAALAVIPRLLSLQTEGDNANATHRYQTVSVAVIEAVVAVVASAKSSVTAKHKGWEALRLITSHAPNHALFFNALHSADGRAGTRILADWMADAQRCLSTYQVSCEDPEALQRQTLERQIILSGLETLTAVTSTQARLDTSSAASEEDEHGNSSSDVEDRASATVTATAALSSGVLSSFVVSLLTSTPPEVLAPVSAEDKSRDETILVGSVTLLGNLADTDPYVNSANCLAALKPWLESSAPCTSNVVDRVLTVLWNVLNSREGAEAAHVLGVRASVQAIAGSEARASSSRANAERLLKKFDAALDNPRYAFSKKR